MNPYGVPEIDPTAVAAKRKATPDVAIVDVREEIELTRAHLGDGIIHMPLSVLAQKYEDAIPDQLKDNKDQEIIVFCHHGARSAQVAAYMRANGWTNVLNMSGGIHQYALVVDPTVGTY